MKITSIFFAILFLFAVGCTNEDHFKNGKRQLESMGYTNVKDTGHSFFCCDEKDTFSSGFTCTDKSGNNVTGCFCSSFTKGVTIRFE